MEISEFLDYIKNAKPTSYTSGELRHLKDHDMKVTSSDDKLTKELFIQDNCYACGKNNSIKELVIKFKKPSVMTIFEAEFMFMLFVQKKLLRDYADYHDRTSGRNFIENIVSVEVKTN